MSEKDEDVATAPQPPRFGPAVSRYTCTSPNPTLTPLSARGRWGQPLPESTTKRIPSMVTEVSAMLVERMHFRTPGGATSNTWGR